MADQHFSRLEVAELARKIGELRLSENERTLLLAIFAAAAGSAERMPGGEARLAEAEIRHGEPESGELGDLQSQLLNAYIPGNSFDSLRGIVMYKIIPGDDGNGK